MPLTNPDHMHTITLSNKALAFLSNCMSFRGGKGLMRVREAIRQGLVEPYMAEDAAKIS